MKKPFIRLLALCLTALILVTLASCKKNPAPSGEETTTVPAVTEVPTTLPVAPTDAPSTLPAETVTGNETNTPPGKVDTEPTETAVPLQSQHPDEVSESYGSANLARFDFSSIKNTYNTATPLYGYVIEYTDLNGDPCALTYIKYKIISTYSLFRLHNLSTGHWIDNPEDVYDKEAERYFGPKHSMYLNLSIEVLEKESAALKGAMETILTGKHTTEGVFVDANALDPAPNGPTSYIPGHFIGPVGVNSSSGTAAPTTEATTAAPAADPASWSREQMVAFVSDAVNKSKAYTGSLTADHNQSFTFEIKSVSPGGAIIQPISQTIVNNLLKPTTETLSFSGGTATDSDGETVPILLPKKQGFALTAAGVASASASANGTDVTVTLTLIPETGNLTAVPANNAAAIGYLDASKVTSLSLFSVEKFDVSYPGSTLKITVNADGYVTAAEYSTPVAIEGAGKIGLIPGSLSSSGESKESWVLHW